MQIAWQAIVTNRMHDNRDMEGTTGESENGGNIEKCGEDFELRTMEASGAAGAVRALRLDVFTRFRPPLFTPGDYLRIG
jgi:hypothetical protein